MGALLGFFGAGPARLQALIIGAAVMAIAAMTLTGWALWERSGRYQAERDAAIYKAQSEVLADKLDTCNKSVDAIADIGAAIKRDLRGTLAEIRKAGNPLRGELAALAAETDLAKLQIATNVEEAKHASIFIAGWRPAVGWVCAAAFAYSYLLLPFLQFLLYAFGTEKLVEQMANLPTLDLAGMLPVLFGMLGLGSLRTAEKIKGAEGNR